MTARRQFRYMLRVAAAGAGLATGVYAAWIATSWCRYGRVSSGRDRQRDDLLNRFMPNYDVVERHHIYVKAPAAVTLAAAKEQELLRLPAVRAIFKARELILRGSRDSGSPPRALLAQARSLGWGVLAELPGREIVVGAVTKPWEANVTFHALPAGDFAAFNQPGFVKIAWNLRADPCGKDGSIFRTQTRALATDDVAGAKFRRYWALVSPGIAAIRWLLLRPLKRDAERRAHDALPGSFRSSRPASR